MQRNICVIYTAIGHAHSFNVEQGRGYEPFTLYRASSAAAPSDQSPKVPFVARGMSLLETSSFIMGCVFVVHVLVLECRFATCR